MTKRTLDVRVVLRMLIFKCKKGITSLRISGRQKDPGFINWSRSSQSRKWVSAGQDIQVPLVSLLFTLAKGGGAGRGRETREGRRTL